LRNSYRILKIVLCSVVAVLGLHIGPGSLLAQAQDSSPLPRAAHSSVSGVGTAYVAAVEKNGTIEDNLKPEDFSVQANGIPLEILEVSKSKGSPLLVGIMVDLSGSAHGQYRRDFLQALDSFFTRYVRDSENAALMAFAMSTYHVTGMTESIAKLRAGIKTIGEGPTRGETALYDCLFTAPDNLFQGMKGRQVLLVLSDFQDNASRRNLGETVAHLQQLGVAVFPLMPIDQNTREFRFAKEATKNAKRIAEQTGGVAASFTTPGEMETALLKMQTLWDSSYVLKYRWRSSPDRKTKLTVAIAGHATDLIAIQELTSEVQ
jgi:VWFA-related protein